MSILRRNDVVDIRELDIRESTLGFSLAFGGRVFGGVDVTRFYAY